MTRTQNRSALRLLVVVVALLTVTGAFAPLAAAQDDSPPEPPHRVFGTVADDAGDPVEGVTVEAVHDGEVVASDTTDADGYYDFDVEGLQDGDSFTVSPGTSSESEALTFESAGSDEVNFGAAEEPDGGDGEDGEETATPTETPQAPAGGGGGGGAAPPAVGGGDGGGDVTIPSGGTTIEVPVEDADPEASGVTIDLTEADDSLVVDEIVFSNESASGLVTAEELVELEDGTPALPANARAVALTEITVPEAQRDEPATLRMSISQQRLDDLDADLDELAVFRLPDDGEEWEQLDATFTRSDGAVTVEFETPGFSTFAVAQQQDEQTPTATDTDGGATDTDEPTDTDDGPSDQDDGLDAVLVGLVALVVLVVIAGAAYYFTRQNG